jgi:hypothetical protein
VIEFGYREMGYAVNRLGTTASPDRLMHCLVYWEQLDENVGFGRKFTNNRIRVGFQLIVGISVPNLLFILGNVMWGEQLVFGIPLAYKITLGLGMLSSRPTAGALVYAVLAWKERYWGIAFRSFYTLVTVAAVAFVWFLSQ